MRQAIDAATAVEESGGERTCTLVRSRIESGGLWGTPGSGSEPGRTHLIGTEPFALSSRLVSELEKLGKALLAFYQAVNQLYLRRSFDWVNEYLDLGKPEELLRHAAMKYHKSALPGVIRPDILITDQGFTITELDSVPGGMGHLDLLSAAYADAGFDILGGARGMRDGYASMIRQSCGLKDPVLAIIVSDESIDYLPEMTYLAQELRAVGMRAWTVRPKEIIFTEDGLWIEPDGGRVRVDAIYRFYELFDLLNIPKAELISYAARKKLVALTPPYKPFLEEKMLLALLHHDALASYWRSALGEEDFELLRRTIAPTWILDNRPVPPHAEIAGFRWRGEPIRDWRVIREGTQKERMLVLKPSGFSPLAWGSRGVKIGHDMAQSEWADAVDEALAGFATSPYVLQPFQETSLRGVRYYDGCGENQEIQARVRLCAYFFNIGGRAELGGVLATAVSKEKKIVHGMTDAVMVPCSVTRES